MELGLLIAAVLAAVAATVGGILQLVWHPKLPEPNVSIEVLSHPIEAPQWLVVVVITKNVTTIPWRGDAIRILRPRGAKVISKRALPRGSSPAWALAAVRVSEIDITRLSNSAFSSMLVAPMGESSDNLVAGRNDTEAETFWVLLPQSWRRAELSIRFSLSSTDSSRRQSKHDFARIPIPIEKRLTHTETSAASKYSR